MSGKTGTAQIPGNEPFGFPRFLGRGSFLSPGQATPDYRRLALAIPSMREYSLVLECRDEMWHCIAIPCRFDKCRSTTDRGLLHISSVHGNEQIADGRSERNMTLAYWGFSRLAHSPSKVRLQVLIKEMTTQEKQRTLFVGIDVHKDTQKRP